jgi:hypothetical protein
MSNHKSVVASPALVQTGRLLDVLPSDPLPRAAVVGLERLAFLERYR